MPDKPDRAMSGRRAGASSKKRRTNNGNMEMIETHYHESEHEEPSLTSEKAEMLDIETVDQHQEELEEHVDQPEKVERRNDHELSEVLGFPVHQKIARGRKRGSMPENPDGTRQRYYDRYKNQEYVKRNDVYKYCQACKKKVFGRLRSLPSEHRLRRCWILRLALDCERSAELWSREAFSDATHCGEICHMHFPIGSESCKNRELMPIDMRGGEADDLNDATYDFDSLELTCVFCDGKNPLRNMIPFVRTRSRRYKWINSLAGDLDNNVKTELQDRLKNGASKFLCDWHFNDEDFDINQYGEWRLRKDALPYPHLTEGDKKAPRVYMINHGDTILSRTVGGPRRDEVLYARKDYRFLAQKARRNAFTTNYYGDYGQYQYEGEGVVEVDESVEIEMAEGSEGHFLDGPLVERGDMPGPSSRIPMADADIEYSDDSDEENEVLEKVSPDGKLQETRYCQQCNRFVSSEKSLKEYRPRTWPYDENKHLKWLEFMNWPIDFDNQMRELWRKRKHGLMSADYHYTPISVCQTHLEYKQLYERYEDWLQTYCVLCDVDHGDPNLLLPFPRDRADRLVWMNALLSIRTLNQAAEQRWKWLSKRLTRPKPTRYRLCVFHFPSEAFVEKDDCVEFNDASLPLPLGLSEYELTPRAIWGYIKCPLCDEWNEQNELVDIRSPTSQAERVLLVEMFNGDKTLMKKGVEHLSQYPCKICKNHLPVDVIDPYSVVAERRLVSGVEIQCIQCNTRDIGANMIPVPFDEEQRAHWVDALGRDPVTKTRLRSRLSSEGRHYLCIHHFHKSALRYIPQLGVWKRFAYLPIPVTLEDREKYLALRDDPYNPLIIDGIDNRGDGIEQELNYDEVLALFQETGDNIEVQHIHHQTTSQGKMEMSSEGHLSTDPGPPTLHPEGDVDEGGKSVKYEELTEGGLHHEVEIAGEIIGEPLEEQIIVDEEVGEQLIDDGPQDAHQYEEVIDENYYDESV